MQEQLVTVLDSLREFWDQGVRVFPGAALGGVLLVLGWVLARMLRKLVVRVLKLLRADVAAEKSGLEDILLRGGVPYTTVTLLGSIVYWVAMFAVTLAVLHAVGLRAVDELFNRIILFLPNVVVAVLVLMFGTMFARFVRGITVTYLSNIGIDGAEFVGHIAQWALIVFVVSVALEQLSIGGQVLVSAFQIAFGALCLALALAFGLGGRAWAEHLLERFWKKGRSS
jgi:hypothetical protein